ncbi:MAG: hypothetical protein WC178_03240 [Candidatus Paceibacterota bacterium]
MGIKDSIKRTVAKGAMKVAQTKTGKKVIDMAMEKQLKDMPEGPQKDAARAAMERIQNMSYEEQQDIAEKMKKLMGGVEMKDDMTAIDQMKMMERIRKMSPQERKEYEELARKMMGM